MKKTATSLRASLPWAAEYTKASLKDWQQLTHSGRHDMVRLQEARLLNANDVPLGPEWLDHALKGDWVDHRECCIGEDFLLIYQVESHVQTLQRKPVEIFTADTLAFHRYTGHGSRIRKGLEGRRTRTEEWAIAKT